MNTQNKNPMVTFLTLLCGVLFVSFLTLFFLYYSPEHEINKKLMRTVAYYDSTYLQKQGATTMLKGFDNLSYDLRSWDGGQTWYAVKMDWEADTVPRKLTVLGEADSIYPNLLQHLGAMDKLTQYVEKNGSLGSKSAITEGEISMLENIGFEVRQN